MIDPLIVVLSCGVLRLRLMALAWRSFPRQGTSPNRVSASFHARGIRSIVGVHRLLLIVLCLLIACGLVLPRVAAASHRSEDGADPCTGACVTRNRADCSPAQCSSRR